MIPYGRQDISPADIEAVISVLKSDFLTQGPAVPRFEAAIGQAVDVPHVVAFSSATAALHIACLTLGLGPGDRLWTVPNTFVASANCALYCGAVVDFVDIDPQSRNISIAALIAKLETAARENILPKIVVPVDFAGTSADMATIRDLAGHYKFRVIEDASHAIGGTYRNRPVGCGEFADITIFSFHPVKIITTGEGGAATTRDPALARRMQLLRSHGISRDPAEMTSTPQGGWYYEQIALGFNYRMTDLQAALGVSQMNRLHEFAGQRQALTARYDEKLSSLPLILPQVSEGTLSALHLYVIELQEDSCPPRAQVYADLREAGIGVNVHYIPVHLQPYYRTLGFRPGDFPAAERYYSRAITLPLYAGLLEGDQDLVVNALERILA